MLLTSVKLISKLSSLQNSIDTKVLIIDDTVEIKRGKYSVSGEVPEFILEHMKKDRDLDLAKTNNGKRTILPIILATFVIGKDGEIHNTLVMILEHVQNKIILSKLLMN